MLHRAGMAAAQEPLGHRSAQGCQRPQTLPLVPGDNLVPGCSCILQALPVPSGGAAHLYLKLSPAIHIAAELGGDAQAARLPPQPHGSHGQSPSTVQLPLPSPAARCCEDLPGAQGCSARHCL